MPQGTIETLPTTMFSLARLKNYLAITGQDSSKDEELALIGDGASGEMEGETGRWFVKRTSTETLNGNGDNVLFVKRPIVSIASLVVDGTTLTPTTQYVFDATLGALYLLSGVFSKNFLNVVITYTYGWDRQDGDNIPRDVLQATFDLAKARWDTKSANAITAASVSIGPATMVIKPTARPPSVQKVIDTWRESRV